MPSSPAFAGSVTGTCGDGRRGSLTTRLRSLDDHTLRDLGFDRSELTSVAAEVTGDAVHTRIRALMMHATP
jgi:hypothetical protein